MISNKTLISLSVVLFGVFVVLFSAIRVSQPNSIPRTYNNRVIAAENRQFEIPDNLKVEGLTPNNPFYWSEMLQDRLHLLMQSSKYNQSRLMTNYANKRLGMGLKMINVGYQELGVEVISKAEKYLFKATQSCKKIEDAKNQQQQIKNLDKTFIQHQQVLERLLKTIPEKYKSSIRSSLQLNKQTHNDILLQI